jgi:excisionase family DNA binding protein
MPTRGSPELASPSPERPAPIYDITVHRRRRVEERISEVTGEPSGRLLLNPTDAAYVLSISRSKLYELAAAGAIPSLHIGKALRFPVEELRRWITEHTQGAGS